MVEEGWKPGGGIGITVQAGQMHYAVIMQRNKSLWPESIGKTPKSE
jgi:hypothetical protein